MPPQSSRLIYVSPVDVDVDIYKFQVRTLGFTRNTCPWRRIKSSSLGLLIIRICILSLGITSWFPRSSLFVFVIIYFCHISYCFLGITDNTLKHHHFVFMCFCTSELGITICSRPLIAKVSNSLCRSCQGIWMKV